MPTPMEIIAQAARLDKTPRTGTMPSVNVTPPVPVPTVAPMAQVAPQLSPTAQYIQDMQTLLRGGIGKLSTGEKLGAVGQILQAAGSRGAADPGAVIQNVRQQQMQKLNAQYQIAQLQKQQQQEQQQRAAIEKYKVALEPDQINALEGLPLEEQAKKVAEIAFRQDQVREVRRGEDGKTRYIFTSGKSKIADFDLPKDFEKIQVGDSYKFYNKDNPSEYLKDANGNEVVVPIAMTAYQRESLGLQRARLENDRRTGGRSSEPSYQILSTDQGFVAVDKKNLGNKVNLGLRAPKVDPFAGIFPPRTGTPIIRK